MAYFMIIENDSGLTVVQRGANETPEQVAMAHGGVIVDEGPFHSYEKAYDAMQTIPQLPEDRSP